MGVVGSNLPSLYGTGMGRSLEQDVKVIKDYLHMLTEQVQHATQNVGDENLDENLYGQLSSIDTLSAQVTGLTTSGASASARITSAEAAIAALQSSVSGAQTDIQSLEAGQLTTAQIADIAYPVGSIYISTTHINPGTLFGIGTWLAFGGGKVPLGFTEYNPGFDTLEETGGALTHTHTLDDGYAKIAGATGSANVYFTQHAAGGWTASHKFVAAETASTSSTQPSTSVALGGSTDDGSSLPPYIVVNMWKRTA